MVDAFGGNRVNVKPPERGVFALDHDGECKEYMKTYLTCLKKSNSDHHNCREQSKMYLKCRMETGLMMDEDLSQLGYGENQSYVRVDPDLENGKETKGFTAGTGVKASRKGKIW